MVCAEHLRTYIIKPTLTLLDMDSESAERLLLGTIAVESSMGLYLHQQKGPALGIYQIEPATLRDVYENFLGFRPDLHKKMRYIKSGMSNEDNLIGNLYYATAIARLIYKRVKEPFPEPCDIDGLANYWKTYYNTEKGKGTVEHFKSNWERYVSELYQ